MKTKNIINTIKTEAEARKFFETIRWPEGIVCPHCGVKEDPYRIHRKSSKETREILRCKKCKKEFSVTTGSLLEDSHIPLIKWYEAFVFLSASKKGISSYQLARFLKITQKSAWFMAHRIRFAFKTLPKTLKKMKGTIEADETYVGGKYRGKRGRGSPNKSPLFALVTRDGDVRTFPVRKVNSKTLKNIIKENIDKSSTIMTDEFRSYKSLDKEFCHRTVQHNLGQYVDGSAYTNTVECFFSLLKRGIIGIYHHVSKKHLHRYADEFGFRWNTRKWKDQERLIEHIKLCEGKRLAYAG